MDFGSALELLRPWVTTGAIVGILGIFVKLAVDNRKLRLAEKSRDQDFQLKVSGDGRTNLQFVIDNLVRDITRVSGLHEHCEEELGALRKAYRGQEEKLNGLSRQFISYQLEVGRAIPPEHRTPMLESLLRQHEALDKNGG